MGINRSVNHITFSIKNLEESLAFYCGILEFVLAAKWPEGAYLQAGDTWIALVVDEKLRSGPLPEYTHVAFSCTKEEFSSLAKRLKTSGVVIWQNNQTEGDSIYILDPNGHKLELHATDLQARLDHARKFPWDGLEIF